MLTYEVLNAAQPELVRLYSDYIPRLTNRAHYAPSLEGCRVLRGDVPRYAATIEVVIRERMNYGNLINRHLFPQERMIVIHYAVYPDGATWAIYPNGTSTSMMFDTDRSVSVYIEPVRAWATNQLEECSKQRIQARARAIHEELVAVVWHPDRVALHLQQGGWDLISAL